MAPVPGRKRARPRMDSVDIDVEEATSHLRQRDDPRKRVRLTPVERESDDETLSSDTFEEEDAASDIQENENDREDETAVRLVADRMRSRATQENHAADNSIIEEVTCTNFMCHKHLTVAIGPLINFIIGHNGSGKSAVLTAIQLCLGGKATSTNRGQSLKHFIKAGEEQATLRVKIKNQGDTAYQPDVYGRSIIVERTFTQAGTSGFKIKDANGKIFSTKKSDLEDILDAMALQMDNPMNVLTQDMARQFLNSSNSTEKYKFFYQGTHLEQLDSDYRIMAESLDQNIQQGHNLEASSEAARKAYKVTEKKAELAERVDSLVDRIHSLRNQCAWAQVEEQERDLARIEQELREQDETIQLRMTKAAEHDARVEAAANAVATANEAIPPLEQELEQKKDEHATVKEDFDDRIRSLLEIQHQQREIKSQIESAQRNIDRVTAATNQEKEKLASADNGQHAQKLEAIQNVKDKLDDLQQEIQAKSSEGDSLDQAFAKTKEDIEASRSRREMSTKDADAAERQLRALESDSGNGMSNFDGDNLPTLLKAIERETRFREKPIGPLGRYVTLLQPQWSSVLEKSAGGILESFAVTSQADQVLLSNLMNRCKHKAMINITRSRPIDVSQHEPAPEFNTWLRALKFDNDLARNVMIINQKIEQTILEESVQKATELLRRRIPHVSQYFAIQSRDHRGVYGARLAHSASGSESQGPIEPWNGPVRMKTDKASQISMQQERVANLKGEQMKAEQAYRELQTKLKEADQAIRRHKRAMDSMSDERDRQEDRLSQLQSELEEATPQTGLLEELEGQLREHTETKEMNENQYQDTVTEKDKLNRENRETKREVDALSHEMAAIQRKIEKAREFVDKAEFKRVQVVRQANEAHETVNSAQQRKEELEQERREQVVTVGQFTEHAEKVSLRVPVDAHETAESLSAKLTKLHEERVRHEQSIGGNKEELMLKKIEARAHMEQRANAVKDHTEIVDTLKRALADREQRWRQFRKAIVIRAKGVFAYLLAERQFRGKLHVNHNDKTLDISVQPDKTRKSDKGRQTKTLSGGEKSFSTICLLLALWEAMGSPIRCLDEFDVFMDNVNRDVSMTMMIRAARRAVSRQFILITPQAMGNVVIGPDVKIHKMSDPERNQTTLRASQFPVRA